MAGSCRFACAGKNHLDPASHKNKRKYYHPHAIVPKLLREVQVWLCSTSLMTLISLSDYLKRLRLHRGAGRAHPDQRTRRHQQAQGLRPGWKISLILQKL